MNRCTKAIALVALSAFAVLADATVYLGKNADRTWGPVVTVNGVPSRHLEWTSGNWWDGLGLSSLWSVTNGVGTNLTANVGAYAGWTIGNPTWTTLAGKTALLLDGNGDAGKFGDIYDLGTNGIAYGAWVWFSTTNGASGVIGKPYFGATVGRYAVYRDGATLHAVAQAQSIGDVTCTGVATGRWGCIAHVITRNGWHGIYTNGALCQAGAFTDNGSALDVARMMTFGTYDDNATSWMSGAVRQYWVRVGNNLTNTPASVWQATRAEYGY